MWIQEPAFFRGGCANRDEQMSSLHDHFPQLNGAKMRVFRTKKTVLNIFYVGVVLLMAEIFHHLACMKPYKTWDAVNYQPQLVSRISAINSILGLGIPSSSKPTCDLWVSSGKPEVLQPEDITLKKKNPLGLWLQFEGFIRMPSNF